jgi:predicted site-specific integrase-resolvase
MKTKLTTRQAAEAAGIGLTTLNEWMAAGKVKAPKPVLRGALGMRLWGERDIERLRAVKAKIYRKGRGRKKKTKT